MKTLFITTLGLLALGSCAEDIQEGPVDFESEGAQTVRRRVCEADWELAGRKGAAAETFNASTLWSVSPYQVLVPTTGEGFVQVNVDAPHYDWLIYAGAEVEIEALDGPVLEYRGPVTECPDQKLVEYGAHHTELASWLLRMEGEGQSRARFYAGLAATDHSNPDEAGHAGHDLSGDEDAPDHGGH